MPPPRADWERIQREYTAGQLSISEIGRQCGVSPQRISTVAKDKGWKRNVTARVKDNVQAILIEDSMGPEVKEVQVSDEAVLAAARRAVDVIKGHRNLLSRLGKVAAKLMVKLEQITDAEDLTQFNQLRSQLLGPNETVFDALIKMSNTVGKVIPLERQAFDLDDQRQLKTLSDEEIMKRACGENVINKLMVEEDEE